MGLPRHSQFAALVLRRRHGYFGPQPSVTPSKVDEDGQARRSQLRWAASIRKITVLARGADRPGELPLPPIDLPKRHQLRQQAAKTVPTAQVAEQR